MPDPRNPGIGASVRGDTPTPGPGVASSSMDTFNAHWWRDNYAGLENVQADRGYEYYEPAFRHGWESAGRYRGTSWEKAEPDISREWSTRQRDDDSRWDEVKHAVRHAFERAVATVQGK